MRGRGRVLQRDSTGKAQRVLGTTSDITVSKEASLVYQEDAERSRAIVEATGCVIICLDTKYHILEWNRAAEKLYGWTFAEVRGKNYLKWFLPEEVREG